MSHREHRKKFMFVTGGVVSALGKGITASAVGAIMEARGLRVGFLKLDPYMNVDPGTMNPMQHGEVFVTDDGAETDLDLGHYERFSSSVMTKNSNFTSGQIYYSVIMKERRGEYLGGTVQVIPHITDEIKAAIHQAAENCDILITEIGGTVGDIEGLPFLEAIRQLRFEMGVVNTLYCHVTLVPYIAAAGELKTKPTQHSVRELREIGIQPDILILRSEREINVELRKKIARFCNVELDDVIACPDVKSIYEIPLLLRNQGIDDRIVYKLNIWSRAPQMKHWEDLNNRILHPKDTVTVGIVGKYVHLTDSYKSLNEALHHGGYEHRTTVKLRYIDSEMIENSGFEPHAAGLDAILVPGGFGKRGIEGKISAVKYARENKIPFFGICLGLQIAVIEFARNVAGLENANSHEFNEKAPHLVIDMMADQKDIVEKGATMRLGAYPCKLASESKAALAYRSEMISERHRHRYEFANAYREQFENAGLLLSGMSPDENLVEVIELPDHPWFLGCQFHPEFKSRPTDPHPLFKSFIRAALTYKKLS